MRVKVTCDQIAACGNIWYKGATFEIDPVSAEILREKHPHLTFEVLSHDEDFGACSDGRRQADHPPATQLSGRRRQAGHLRSAGLVGNKESKLVGVIPVKMWTEWAKKWGVKPNDHEAMKDVVARELADPDNAAFRVWEGKF